MAHSDPMSQTLTVLHTYPDAHLLGIPTETRLCIYQYILTDIQAERRNWNGTPLTSYDGMRLACKQLYLETVDTVFLNFVTTQRASRLLLVPVNKNTFETMRSLYVEINLRNDHEFFCKFANVLERFQLSLQELHMFFFGQDSHGVETNNRGCAKILEWHNTGFEADLAESGQEIAKKLTLMRQLLVLRNLRLLHIHNANIPVIKGAIMINKHYLQALSIICDSRSQSHGFQQWLRYNRELFTGLLIPTRNFPPIHALELDANAIVPVEAVVNNLAPTLRHFSWRVPNFEFQKQCFDKPTHSFYSITERLMQTLSWRAPNLRTLRLCVQMRNLPVRNEKYQQDMGLVTSGFLRYLPRCSALKHLEIHQTGADYFFRCQLIDSLPHGLQRLYISDITISTEQLVEQVRTNYLKLCCRDEDHHYGAIDLSDRSYRASDHIIDIPEVSCVAVNSHGYVSYLTAQEAVESKVSRKDVIHLQRLTEKDEGYLNDYDMLGEDEMRQDRISLNTGKLGFINFQYDATTWGDEDELQYEESDTTRIFRLNGLLLDREHNLHLADFEHPQASYGIPPKQIECFDKSNQYPQSQDEETGDYSRWPGIHLALHTSSHSTRNELFIEQTNKELEKCFEERSHWYFGNEEQAERVFKSEPAAKFEDQKKKPMVTEIVIYPSKKCEWACPNPTVPPVGSFPMPKVPSDWKDRAS